MENLEILVRSSQMIREEKGFTYRDLNKNGKLDVYEDPRQPTEHRVNDLLSQMTLEEKAGMLFINGSAVNEDGSIDDLSGQMETGTTSGPPQLSAKAQMDLQQMNHFNLWEIPDAKTLSIWSQHLQQYAEETRLGIPVTLASDPRHHFSRSIYEMQAKDFSQWCQPLGLAAVGDEDLVL